MLKSINLSLSTKCNANCIYCALDRGDNIKVKDMPIMLVRKITAELTSKNFIENHNVTHFQLSENGDALLNKDFLKIVRLLKRRLPDVKKTLYTNLELLDKKKTEALLNEGLITQLCCSIDSVDEKTFGIINNLSFKKVMRNFKYFLQLRDELDSKVNVVVRMLSLNKYATTILEQFKFLPGGLGYDGYPLIDETPLIEAYIGRYMTPNKDRLLNSCIFGWNLRHRFANAAGYTPGIACPFLERNDTEAFIAPDGSWYSCCLDSKPERVFGNVNDESLNAIFHKEIRKEFLQKLADRKFIELGGACKTVICCLNLRR